MTSLMTKKPTSIPTANQFSVQSACVGHAHDIEESDVESTPRAVATAATLSATSVDHARIQAAVREILIAVGEDPDREGLLETPARVARMYAEMFSRSQA